MTVAMLDNRETNIAPFIARLIFFFLSVIGEAEGVAFTWSANEVRSGGAHNEGQTNSTDCYCQTGKC
jgi:hypothetical protein